MKVWGHTKKVKTLLHQRFYLFLWNIIYTVFYARFHKATTSKS